MNGGEVSHTAMDKGEKMEGKGHETSRILTEKERIKSELTAKGNI